MSGKSGDQGLKPAVTSGIQSNETALAQMAAQQNSNSQTLFNESNPGVVQAESFYSSLASGDPGKIATAIAPATEQIAKSTAGAKENIMQNAPSGGEKNLALEKADVSQGEQVGKAATGSFLNSFNALGQLGAQGTSASTSAAEVGISGYGSATNALTSIGGLQMQQQQMKDQEKGQTLGALSSLAGSVMEGAGSAGSLGALFAL